MTNSNIGTTERVASVLTGAVLIGFSGKRGPLGKALMIGAGSEMVRRGISGRCYLYQALGTGTRRQQHNGHNQTLAYESGVHANDAITINKPPEEVYKFWRNLENLPRFLHHLKSVTPTGEKTSHWVAEGPTGGSYEWDAEILEDHENEMISWRSLPGADVDSAGSVHFKPAPGCRGTEVRVKLQYDPPGGKVTAAFAKLFGRDPGSHIHHDLRHLKQHLEGGSIATVKGQAHWVKPEPEAAR